MREEGRERLAVVRVNGGAVSFRVGGYGMIQLQLGKRAAHLVAMVHQLVHARGRLEHDELALVLRVVNLLEVVVVGEVLQRFGVWEVERTRGAMDAFLRGGRQVAPFVAVMRG